MPNQARISPESARQLLAKLDALNTLEALEGVELPKNEPLENALWEHLLAKFPELGVASRHEPAAVATHNTVLSKTIFDVIEHVLSLVTSWRVVFSFSGAATLPVPVTSPDRSFSFITAPTSAGGVRFVATSRHPEVDGTRLIFRLEPPNDEWRREVSFARVHPDKAIWEARLELSSAQLKTLKDQYGPCYVQAPTLAP